jgi:polysaccharide export outer membrane protein
MRWKSIVPVLVFVFIVSVAGGAAAQTATAKVREGNKLRDNGAAVKAPPSAAVPSNTDYIIGPDDVLAINVWKEPDVSRAVPVRSDGKITLPLIGDVDAVGATPGQLQAKLEKQLAEYISNPSVTVIVQEAKSHKFNVIGQVNKPGTYVISGSMTILDAIALSGGFREWAKTNSIYILRTEPGGEQKIHINYKKVLSGKAPAMPLKIHDTVVVP